MIDNQKLKHACQDILSHVKSSDVVKFYHGDILLDVSQIMKEKPDLFIILLRESGTQFLNLSNAWKKEDLNNNIDSFMYWMNSERSKIEKEKGVQRFISCINGNVSYNLGYNDVIRLIRVFYTGMNEIEEIKEGV